ncbi:MAG TPA: nucleotidyltransferase family protein [Bacteroidales bacterium]|nr:nucleotidyltransferase family protein [Bacteroidales bacterium]
MKALILAAGYATRLYPLTQNFPKPLLVIGGISILDRLLGDLEKIDAIDEHIVVTNATFSIVFQNWLKNKAFIKPVRIVNDGTTTNDNRLGAVKDILFVLDSLHIKDDLLVLAGDNVVDFSFAPFVRFAVEKGRSCLTCHEEPSIKALQKTGVLEADQNMRVIAMHEKPQLPPSHWAVPPFYFYRKDDLPLVRQALENGCGADAPGNLMAWLCKQTEVYAWPLPGKRFDIGDLASYEAVNELFTTGK